MVLLVSIRPNPPHGSQAAARHRSAPAAPGDPSNDRGRLQPWHWIHGGFAYEILGDFIIFPDVSKATVDFTN